MKLTKIAAIFAVVAGLLAPIAASAETVSLKMVMVPKETIRMKFGDGTKHFVAMVRREGKSEGTGALGGASVTEYGWHDINPPVGADPHGYLQFKAANGDLANIKWTVRAVFFRERRSPSWLITVIGNWSVDPEVLPT
jgi:hypothetical protein